MPDEAELELTAPPGFASAEEFRDRILAALAEREDKVSIAAVNGNRDVVGMNAHALPRVRSLASVEPRRQLKPRVACRDKWKRIEALTRLHHFLRAYREAWRALRLGDRDALFPAGTYWLRIAYGVRCTAPS
jgi:hypothetical protein